MEKEIFNRNKGLDYLSICIEENKDRIYDNKTIRFDTNGYFGEMYLDKKELELIIERLTEFKNMLKED